MTVLSQRLNGLASMIPSELKEEEMDTENEKREVNWFLGWAIWHLRCKLSKRRIRAKVNDWILAENVEPLIQHLDKMRFFHHNAIIDQEYMQHCYSQADQSRNGGWLSLVSKEFFDFGKVLLSQIRDSVKQNSGVGMAMHRSKLQPQQSAKMPESRKPSLTHEWAHQFLFPF
jgi:hypothetical protein